MDGNLSRLQQFERSGSPRDFTGERGIHARKAVSATQTALYLMGNTHQQISQKKAILKLNLSLKFMAEDNKVLFRRSQCCLGKNLPGKLLLQ